MKRILSVILILVLLVSVSGCGGESNREYDEAEVIREAKRLIPLSAVLNEIYYGKGIMASEGSEGVGAYKPALDSELKRYGFSTVEELKARTRVVFSASMSENMFSTVLSAVSDEDDTIVGYARYYQEKSDKGEDLRFMVLTNYSYVLKNTIEYGENITVIGSVGQIVKISVPVKLTREDGKVKEKNITVDMIEEESGWRLASASYAVYNESTDRYEDLIEGLEEK